MKPNNHLKLISFETRNVGYLSILLLVIGSMVFGISAYKSLLLTKQIAATRNELNVSQSQLASKKTSQISIENPEQIEILQRIKNQNDYAWDKLFLILEVVHNSNVYLMQMQPTIEKKEVLISAESADVHQMLDYTRALGLQPSVDHIELLNHETIMDNQQEKIRFLIMIKLR